MRIGELAARAGTTTRALRYYESRGLLAARRDANGHRVYAENDLRLLEEIRTLQDLGFELEETRPFAECLRAGKPTGDACPASLEVYRRKLAELERYIGRLETVRDGMRARLAEMGAVTAEEDAVGGTDAVAPRTAQRGAREALVERPVVAPEPLCQFALRSATASGPGRAAGRTV